MKVIRSLDGFSTAQGLVGFKVGLVLVRDILSEELSMIPFPAIEYGSASKPPCRGIPICS